MLSKKQIAIFALLLIVSLAVIPELAKAMETYTFVSELYGQIPPLLNFGSGLNVAVDSSGNIFVVDYSSNSIKKFTSEYGPVPFTFGATFNKPADITFDSQGNIYVGDNDNVRKFDSNGALLGTIGTWVFPNPIPIPGGSTVTNTPGSLAIDSQYIYITAPYENRVYKFSLSGSLITSWGNTMVAPSSANGQFNGPGGIGVFGGYVYVADSQNQRVEKFTDAGVYVSQWLISSSGSLPNYVPTDLVVDKSGNVFVSISFSSCILKFRGSNGGLLATIGTPHAGITDQGRADGQFNQQIGIDADRSGYVYVADAGNNRIEKFGPPQAPPTSSDFFVFNSIPTPQTAGKPFLISITAERSLGHTDKSFTGTATLTCSNGATISPSVTANFVNGYWEGYVTINSPGSHIYLIATASDGTRGESINFDVIPELVVPEYGFAALSALMASFAAFVLIKKRNIIRTI